MLKRTRITEVGLDQYFYLEDYGACPKKDRTFRKSGFETETSFVANECVLTTLGYQHKKLSATIVKKTEYVHVRHEKLN